MSDEDFNLTTAEKAKLTALELADI